MAEGEKKVTLNVEKMTVSKLEPAELAAGEATVVVSKTVLKQKQPDKVEKIKIRPFVTSTATVSVKMGLTIGLPNFGSARIDVMVSSPCYKEEIVDVYTEVRTMVDDLLDKEAETMEVKRLGGEEE